MEERGKVISTSTIDKSVNEIEKRNSIEEFFAIVDKLNKKEEIVEQLAIVVEQSIDDLVKKKVKILKQAFLKLKEFETKKSIKTFTKEEAENSQKEKDTTEEKLKKLLARFHERKLALTAETEKTKKQNLIDGKNIIERIKKLIANQEKQDNFREIFDEFKELQHQWKKITQTSHNYTNDLWKKYRHYSEQFYELVKLNDIMRDYSFKKNLELKQALCNTVEQLEKEPDVISAFHQMNRFYHEWKEIGPVAHEYRKDVWIRFKQAMSVIDKKYQQHFEKLKECKQENLEKKIALCEEIENIDYSTLVSFKEWNKQIKRVLEIQNRWKTIGLIPKKYIKQLSNRFNVACDAFFCAKNNSFENIKATLSANLKKKETLCEEAESLKDSQEWKETTDKLVALQKKWKSIGSVSYKHSEVIWKRFIDACDYFFERKNVYFFSQKNGEMENLKNKKEIISNIQAIDTSLPMSEIVTLFRKYIVQFENIGFVPFDEKKKIYEEYYRAIDGFLELLKKNKSEKELQLYESDLNTITKSNKSKLLSERDKLIQEHTKIKNNIQTYENNIGFLFVSSKKGNILIQEMQDKINDLKSSLILIEKKIETFNQKIEN